MKWAVLTLTKGALEQAKIISKKFNNVDIFTLSKWREDNIKTIKGKLEAFVGEIFDKYDCIIFIMATGIVVRVISKHICHKATDPAVLVIDEKGRFVISLLSGHLGRANEYTNLLAKSIGAKPVITTASDVKGSIAVDTLAMKLNCGIENLTDAKEITALIVNDEIVGIRSDIKINFELPSNVVMLDDKKVKETKGDIVISNKRRNEIDKPMVQLIPRNIVLGIGCKRGVPKKNIIDVVNEILEKLNLHHKSIKHLATADLKGDEEGIIEAAKHYHVPLKIISRKQIKEIENRFESSEFVKKSIGVGCVCEPCAYLSSNKGKFLMKKRAFSGITLSVWEEA